MTTLAQMENELRAMQLTDSLVRRVMTMADREGCSPTERYMWLAWSAVNMLREVQAQQLRVAREAPPAPVLMPIDMLPEGYAVHFPSDKIPNGWVHAPQFDTEEATKRGIVAAMKAKKFDDTLWIDWAGGNNPCDSDEIVAVRQMSGIETTGMSRRYDWHQHHCQDDIVAYRVIRRI